MKKRNVIACAALAVLLAACIPSVYPFYTDKDVVFDQRLLGEWHDTGDTNNPEIWKFAQSTNNAYNLTVVEDGKTGEFAAHLFKLKQDEFLDLIPTDCKFADNQAGLVAVSMFPGHLLLHVSQIEPSLKVAMFNLDWLEKYLEQNPKALAYHQEASGVVLTADTAALQNFVLSHLGTNELFQEGGEMVRAKK